MLWKDESMGLSVEIGNIEMEQGRAWGDRRQQLKEKGRETGI